ncbi:hypothetical protein PGC34_11060 [Pseudomonas kribbensis]|uniref:hypothetical protein n=1 Tax=Pseudomonas kribbensis TaxID=1628086 RepID=UPI003BF7D5A3
MPAYERAKGPSARIGIRLTNGFANIWWRPRESRMPQRNRKRHHDHARKRKIEIHELFILSFIEVVPL